MLRATILLVASFALLAQSPGPTFEVAAIHPSRPGTPQALHYAESGGLSAAGFTLNDLIRMGWRVRDFQIIGGPAWVNSKGFDVEAKGDHSATDAQLGQMVQSLLADRFKLALHRETRQLPVYALVVAKNGPKISEGTAARPGMTGGPGQLDAQKISMLILTQTLGRQLDHPVLDRTGLPGRYDFKLEWSPDESNPAAGPSIFTAVQEQLGLKLETQTGPVEILVIDHAEKPSEN
jgi:uncharacterized protein (TIGR03435 family)